MLNSAATHLNWSINSNKTWWSALICIYRYEDNRITRTITSDLSWVAICYLIAAAACSHCFHAEEKSSYWNRPTFRLETACLHIYVCGDRLYRNAVFSRDVQNVAHGNQLTSTLDVKSRHSTMPWVYYIRVHNIKQKGYNFSCWFQLSSWITSLD